MLDTVNQYLEDNRRERKARGWRYFRTLTTIQDNATNSVYAYVPVEMVVVLIEEHGGIA